MTTQEYLSNICRETAYTLCKTASYVPEENYNWSPMGEARPVWDMLLECACILEAAKRWLEHGEMNFGHYINAREEAKQNPPALPELEARLRAAAEAYAQSIASLSDEQAAQEVPNPMTGKNAQWIQVASLPIMNMVYHFGQVNYIQMMLGDTEMH